MKMVRFILKTVKEFKDYGGEIIFEGLNSVHLLEPKQQRHMLVKGYLNGLYYIFLDNIIVSKEKYKFDKFGKVQKINLI